MDDTFLNYMLTRMKKHQGKRREHSRSLDDGASMSCYHLWLEQSKLCSSIADDILRHQEQVGIPLDLLKKYIVKHGVDTDDFVREGYVIFSRMG